MNSLRIFCVAVVLLGVAAASGADADKHRDRGDRARTLLVLRIAEELDLPDEEGPADQSHPQGVRGIDAQPCGRSDEPCPPKLEAAIDSGDDGAIESLIEEAREIDRKILLLPSDSFAEVGEILTVAERGKLTLLIPRIQDQLRRGARRARRDSSRRTRWSVGRSGREALTEARLATSPAAVGRSACRATRFGAARCRRRTRESRSE